VPPGFYFWGYAAQFATEAETGSRDCSHSAADCSGISVRLPTLTARSLPALISSYAVVLPTLYELQNSSILNAAFDIYVSAVVAHACAVTDGIRFTKG
jgi:hypothetical protein